jgi:phosphoribosylanthranilate isomerase
MAKSMHRTRIKFCGMTRADDIGSAVDAGVDSIGLIFVPGSARQISVDRAAPMLWGIGPFVTVVAVFADAPVEQIIETTNRLAIGTVQLHGTEPYAILKQLGHLRVIKAVRTGTDRPEQDMWWTVCPWQWPCNYAGLLWDTPGPGGTGVVNDWDWIAKDRDRGPIVVAGGLTPENVGDVVRKLRPYGVDVSSGIEISKGIKSAEKMRAFVAAVRAADTELSDGDCE